MILRFKEARKGRSGRKRVVATEIAADALLHGRIDTRSGAFHVEGEHLVFEFLAHEAVVVWELLKQAFDGKFIEAPAGKVRHHDARRRRVGTGHRRRPAARAEGGSARSAGARRPTG
jgi:hypothetical protein